MKLRRVQLAASASSPIVLCYLVGSHMDRALRESLPGCAIAATDESGLATDRGVIAQARTLTGADSGAPLVLVGYSAGCQGVRRHLWDGEQPAAVVAIDGTHGSVPPRDEQIRPWRLVAERARRGEAVMVATCTQQSYTERLPAHQRFAASRTVLREATGEDLGPGTEVHMDGMHLYGYASAPIDRDAHIRQQREVLPEMLRRHVSLLATDAAPSGPGWLARASAWAGSVVESLREPREEPATLGLRALEIARSQLGVREATGRNDGDVATYFDGATRRVLGRELPTGWQSGWDWCAAFASWCGWRAAAPGGCSPPHGRRIAVWELVRDARELGRWDDVERLPLRPRPGDLLVWRRSGDPRIEGQTGHVSRCVSWDGSRLTTIGGNEENRVRLADVTADLSRCVGVIRY